MSKTMPLILAVPTGSGLADAELANYKNAKAESYVAVAKGTTFDIFTGQKLVRSGNAVETANADSLAGEMVQTCECAKCKHTTYAHVTIASKIIDDSVTKLHCAACGAETAAAVDTHAYVEASLALFEEEADMGDEPVTENAEDDGIATKKAGPGAPTLGDKAPADDHPDDKNGGNKIEDEHASSETYKGLDTDDEAEKDTSPKTVKAEVTLNPVGMEGANDASADAGTDDDEGLGDDCEDDDIDPDADWEDDMDDGEDGSDNTDDEEGEGDEMDSEGAAATVVLKAKVVKAGPKSATEAASSHTYKLDSPGEANIVSSPATVVTEGENNDSNYTGDDHLPGNNAMPGVPRGVLEISSKLPAPADFRGDLVDLAMRGDAGTRVAYVFYKNEPVGTLEEAKSLDAIKPAFEDINKLHRGFVIAASMDSAKDYGFAPYVTKVEIADMTAQEVAKVQGEYATKLNEAVTENAERFRQSLSIAALASVKGVWKHVTNPVRDQLVATLEQNGFEGAAATVDQAFAQGGPDFIKSLLTAALEYSAKSDTVREEIAHMVANATPRVSTTQSDALETASRLTRGSLRVSAVDPAPVDTTREVASREGNGGSNVASFGAAFKKLRANG